MFDELNAKLLYANKDRERVPNHEVRLIQAQPVQAKDLVRFPRADDIVGLNNKTVYPFLVERAGNKDRTEFFAVANVPLSKQALIDFYDHVAPYKIFSAYSLEAAADDWAFMTTKDRGIKTGSLRRELEDVHAGIYGFKDFRDNHAADHIGALFSKRTEIEHKIYPPNKAIVPVLWWEVYANERTGLPFHQDWKTDKIKPALRKQLLHGLKGLMNQLELSSLMMCNMDTYIGASVPAYMNPDIMEGREQEQMIKVTVNGKTHIRTQRMTAAQAPVDNLQRRRSAFSSEFMKNLQEHTIATGR